MKFYLICYTPQNQKFYIYLNNVENGVVTITFSKTILHAEAFSEYNVLYYAGELLRQYPKSQYAIETADTGFDFRTLLAS